MPVESPRLLVVSATRAEAAHVPPDLPVLITGIGKTAAATAVSRELATLDEATRAGLTVVNLGTAGALRPGLEGLHEPRTVLNHDISADALRTLGYDPEDELEVSWGDETVLATGDLFVNDPVMRDHLATRADLVDMEGYAVAYAARAFGVPVRLVKHVSDAADESAMDWPSVVDASARELARRLVAIAEVVELRGIEPRS